MKQISIKSIENIKILLFIVCLVPLVSLVMAGLFDSLGADPVKDITSLTGDWALRLLLVTIAFTPVQKFTGWYWLIRLRREVALYAFFYAALHCLSYMVFEQGFDWAEIGKDIVKRPHITVGFISFILMIPLAITSNNTTIKWLGGRNWKRLHRLTYFVGIGGVFHYFLLVKRDVTNPLVYLIILLVLLGARMGNKARRQA